MGAYLYIPWFKLDQWDVPLPHLVGIVLALSALAALNPKWRSSALSTVVTACGAAAVAWFFFDVQEVPIQPFGVLVATGVLLDGYPRNVSQADELLTILSDLGKELSAVVAIDVPGDVVRARLAKRADEQGRGDDKDPETVNNRLVVYEEHTAPCVPHLESKGVTVHHIDGVGSVDEITSRILGALGIS